VEKQDPNGSVHEGKDLKKRISKKVGTNEEKRKKKKKKKQKKEDGDIFGAWV